MSRFRLLLRTLWYFRLVNGAVALAVAVGTAVLVGSLVVGDSVRTSLTGIVLKRLGVVDHLVVAPNLFGADLARRLEAAAGFAERFDGAECLLWTRGSATCPAARAFASGVNVYGRADVAPGTCVLSERLAAQLAARPGETVVVRMDPMNRIAAELPVGVERTDVALMRLRVARVAASGGFEDAFSFHGGQRPVRNAWVPIDEMRSSLEIEPLANVLVVAARDGHASASDAALLNDMLVPACSLEDYALRVSPAPGGDVAIESRGIIISERVEEAAVAAFGEANRVYAYLATTVRARATGREFPYSMVAGIDSIDGRAIAEGAVVLNAWAAEQLDAREGDALELTYVVRAESGLLIERTATLTVERVIAMDGLGADASLVPEFKGLTDADSISTWEPPRDLAFRSERIRPVDEEYWDAHRAAPKAFVGMAEAARLWGTPFGRCTSVRVPSGAAERVASGAAERVAAALLERLRPADAGLVFRPVRERMLGGASGSTDFSQLFIGFNFFLVVSAALLVVLTMRLSIEQRSRQVGVLDAMGFPPAAVRNVFLAEALVVLVAGTALGSAASAGYAQLMLAGLRTHWIGAVGTTHLAVSVLPTTVFIGSLAGLAVGAAAVWRGLSGLGAAQDAALIAGGTRLPAGGAPASSRHWLGVAVALAATALTLAAVPAASAAVGTTAAFFVAGSALLVAGLAALQYALSAAVGGAPDARPSLSVAGLGLRNAARNGGRSVLTAGLIAAAAFVTIAVGSMKTHDSLARRAPGEGQGGYTLVAEFDVPLPYDPNLGAGRSLLGLSGAEADYAGVRFATMMVNAGEDVSCRNLYTPLDPRVTSVPEEFMTAAPFVFAATAREVENPWRLLEEDLPSGAVPAILDYAAARWILHKGLGDRIAVTDGDGVARELEIVGLLSQSIFQNEVLVSPARFRRLFGGITGFAQVLVATPVDRIDAVRARLAADLVDFGVSVEPTNDRLAAFAAIADSYIDAFTALGQLGLLLGTLGLVVVLLRTAAERRGELALLSAVGLRGRRIALVLTAENAFVLAWGFVAGIAAAAVAVWPELAQAGGAASSALATVAAFLAMAGAIAALLGVVAAGLVRSIGPADLRAE